MRTAAANEFVAAIGSFAAILQTARKNRYSLSTHRIYAPRSRAALARLRKSFILMKRDYSEERYPGVAFQIASIEPLVEGLIGNYPNDSKGMQQLIQELSFKSESDLAAELDAPSASLEAEVQEPPFLPDDLIEDRLVVMQKVLWEANKCYARGCYNACAAMIRRLVENLVIEAYEHHQISDRIKKDGEYIEFGALIGKAANEAALRLTRNTKRILPDLKFFGDIGAHNRMMLVKKGDLDRLHQAIRSGIDELARNV